MNNREKRLAARVSFHSFRKNPLTLGSVMCVFNKPQHLIKKVSLRNKISGNNFLCKLVAADQSQAEFHCFCTGNL